MNLIILIYTGLLFFVLTPRILVKIPSHASPLTLAVVHAFVFTVIFYFTVPLVSKVYEGFQDAPPMPPPSPPPPAPPPATPPPSPSVCDKDSDCGNGSVCNNLTKTCIVTKLLATGSPCNRSRVCINGCNIDLRQCI